MEQYKKDFIDFMIDCKVLKSRITIYTVTGLFPGLNPIMKPSTMSQISVEALSPWWMTVRMQ